MNIEAISKYAWKNSIPIPFGNVSEWDKNLFTSDWAKSTNRKELWRSLGSGLYWLSVKMTYAELHALNRPPSLPQNGCNIGLVAHENEETFGSNLLCVHDKDKWLVVYNGHEKRVTNRVRSHFSLQNDKTGALGLIHYPLSHKEWRVNVFTEAQIGNLKKESSDRIKLLLKSASGRCSLESSWRAKHRWPILCKE